MSERSKLAMQVRFERFDVALANAYEFEPLQRKRARIPQFVEVTQHVGDRPFEIREAHLT